MEYLTTACIFFALGLAGGFLGGMLGVGGGIIFVPTLTHYLRKWGTPEEALVKCVLANSLLTIVFTGLAASFKQFRQNNFHPRAVLATAFPGIVSSVSMTYLIAEGNWYNKERFTFVFLIILAVMLLRTYFQNKKNFSPTKIEEVKLHRFALTGFVAGIVTAISGLGGGLIMVPAFHSLLKLDLKKSISVSTGVIPFFALPITVFYSIKSPSRFPESVLHIGHIVPELILPMAAGVILASRWGVTVATQLPEKYLRHLMLALVCIVALKMLWEAAMY
ncbi:MAG: sulfite exporter TauE/SafE family protein [Chitinophagales bacterium]|nr:sulfite exporter TauE/SafE family protein [Chitinophagales bacterium]MDW8273960.1 sulfite exporter TauE/SafE family protein [Chitinophagales bacterium]